MRPTKVFEKLGRTEIGLLGQFSHHFDRWVLFWQILVYQERYPAVRIGQKYVLVELLIHRNNA